MIDGWVLLMFVSLVLVLNGASWLAVRVFVWGAFSIFCGALGAAGAIGWMIHG